MSNVNKPNDIIFYLYALNTLYGPHNVGKISIVNDYQKNEILTKMFLFIKILVSSEGFLIKKI